MNRIEQGWLAALVIIIGALPGELFAQPGDRGWDGFLGPDRNGISQEVGLLNTWPTGGPREVWRVPGGIGMSGLAVAEGRVVTMVQRAGQQWLVALDANTGKTLHAVPIAPEYMNAMGNGPRATPSVSRDRAFCFTGEGILAAVDLEKGKTFWSHHVVDEMGGPEADYGMASSPLLAGEMVIVTPGAKRGTVAAYHRESGELLWSTPIGAGPDPAGYSSPVLREIAGSLQLLVFDGQALAGLRPETGELLWRHAFETNYECNIALPIVIKNQLLISAGEDHGTQLLVFQNQAGKELSVVWESQGRNSVLRSEWQTPIYHDGYLYGMDNVGGAGPITHLTCIEANTGQRLWQKSRFGKGNLIFADEKLFISTMMGELVVVRASPEKYDELGRVEVLQSTRQAPALRHGLLYVRDDNDIVCLDVRQQ